MPLTSARTILVVDDDAPVRMLVSTLLKQAGYEVKEAPDGLAACQILEQPGAGVDLVVTDLVMPRMTGGELVSRVKAGNPAQKVLCMSGYADVPHPCGSEFLQKPFTGPVLLSAVRRSLG